MTYYPQTNGQTVVVNRSLSLCWGSFLWATKKS